MQIFVVSAMQGEKLVKWYFCNVYNEKKFFVEKNIEICNFLLFSVKTPIILKKM
jgi:hypothetical protein